MRLRHLFLGQSPIAAGSTSCVFASGDFCDQSRIMLHYGKLLENFVKFSLSLWSKKRRQVVVNLSCRGRSARKYLRSYTPTSGIAPQDVASGRGLVGTGTMSAAFAARLTCGIHSASALSVSVSITYAGDFWLLLRIT
jgi:hypothetical protein